VWYVIQAIIAFGIAFYWTTLPGNNPTDFGHGLFLGGIIAWFVTSTVYATLDLFIRHKQQSQSLPTNLINRRSHEKPSHQIRVRRRMPSRPPKLIP
jgi:hypothetical protein